MLTSVQLTTVAANIIAGSPTQNKAITCIHACNISGSPATVNLFAVPAGGTANDATLIFKNTSIANSATLVIDTERIILGNGDALWANASANSAINFTVSSIGV